MLVTPLSHDSLHYAQALECKLDPKRNRSVPPLQYDVVHALAVCHDLLLIVQCRQCLIPCFLYSTQEEFPSLSFAINGGFTTYSDIHTQLDNGSVADATTDGGIHSVMVGRAVMNDSFFLKGADELFHGQSSDSLIPDNDLDFRIHTLEQFADYADGVRNAGNHAPSVHVLCKPVLNAFHGVRVACVLFRFVWKVHRSIAMLIPNCGPSGSTQPRVSACSESGYARS